LGLPKKDGASALSEWRRAGRAMPVLILTARDRWSDKVQGFDAGLTITSPSPSISRKSSPGCARCCRRRPCDERI
jgi:CheY-like chemotaxis protein